MKPFDAFTQSFHGRSLSSAWGDGFNPREVKAIRPAMPLSPAEHPKNHFSPCSFVRNPPLYGRPRSSIAKIEGQFLFSFALIGAAPPLGGRLIIFWSRLCRAVNPAPGSFVCTFDCPEAEFGFMPFPWPGRRLAGRDKIGGAKPNPWGGPEIRKGTRAQAVGLFCGHIQFLGDSQGDFVILCKLSSAIGRIMEGGGDLQPPQAFP